MNTESIILGLVIGITIGTYIGYNIYKHQINKAYKEKHSINVKNKSCRIIDAEKYMIPID